jgi:hypothetical protein
MKIPNVGGIYISQRIQLKSTLIGNGRHLQMASFIWLWEYSRDLTQKPFLKGPQRPWHFRLIRLKTVLCIRRRIHSGLQVLILLHLLLLCFLDIVPLDRLLQQTRHMASHAA